MSKMARTDDIDELVSSVRDFVSHKEPQRTRSRILRERLLLTPELRVNDEKPHEVPAFVGLQSDTVQSNVHVLNHAKGLDKVGLEATIAELEAAVTAQSDDWEPDEGESFGQDAWAASAFHTPQGDSHQTVETEPDDAPATEAEEQHPLSEATFETARRELTSGPVETIAAEAGDKLVATDAVAGLDEAVLRKMVVQIVHEELSGALGERITRNVRKLVRREINRVLTSREMGQD